MAYGGGTMLDKVRRIFRAQATWPPEDLRETWEQIEKFEAFRTSDEAKLRMLAFEPWYSRYLISPVPRMISRASAHLLYGEPPVLGAPNEADQTRLDFIVSENELDTEIHRAAMISSSEGEVWGRICVRRELLDVPIIEFASRRNVIPHFAGRFLLGATFVCEYQIEENEVLRLFESYLPGIIQSEAYLGTRTSIGVKTPMERWSQTAGTPEAILTGIDQPLVAFIPNSIDADPSRGYSDYAGLEERFLGINRASTIADTNTELAGKKRALIDGKYVGPRGEISGDDIYVSNEDMRALGEQGPLKILEYSYDSGQITLWLDHLIDSTLTFGGTAPQLVGRDPGAALSGTALKLKMIHSLLESSGKGRYGDRGITRLLRFAQVIDSRPTTEIGFGRGWAKADERPSIERQDPLPHDDLEAAQIAATLVGAEAISVEERVRFIHPKWTEEQVTEEVKLLQGEIEEARALPAPSFPGEIPPEVPATFPA